ncbi:MAG: ribose-5-phosphate isomerase RpiA [Gammaproteobacteria bacterium]|nr:ribose-5-phosphate isomerase RpiA [Gammaproteobacteria bacterium]
MDQEQLKQQVAQVAADFVTAKLKPHDILGVGTGSTVNHFIAALHERNVSVRGAFSSSEASSAALADIGIQVFDSNCGERAALYVDGADEIDARGALTKGGGGALTREKIVAALSDVFICLVDETKLVDRLGGFPIPVEVIPMARAHVAARLAELGGEPRLREDFRTDNGNVILDVAQLEVQDPEDLECTLNNIPGVVENGVFWENRPTLALVSCGCGVEVRGAKQMLASFADLLQGTGVCCETTFSK